MSTNCPQNQWLVPQALLLFTVRGRARQDIPAQCWLHMCARGTGPHVHMAPTHGDTSTVTITHANTRTAPPAGLQDPPHTSHPHACSTPCPHENAKTPPPDLCCPPPVTITPPTRKMQREHAEGAAAAAAAAASPAPSRAHAHARPRPTRATPTRAPRPPGPALTSHRPPGGRGCPPMGEGPALRGGGASAEGEGAAARLAPPGAVGRRRGPGRPGRPRGDSRGNGSLRRRSRRCRRCPGPAAVARRPLLPWPPLSRAPSPGDNARETGEGDRGTPKTN